MQTTDQVSKAVDKAKDLALLSRSQDVIVDGEKRAIGAIQEVFFWP